MTHPEIERPDDEDQSPSGRATTTEETTDVAQPASPKGATAEVATRPAKAPVNIGGPQTDIDKMFRLASAMSQSGLLPQSLRGKPSDVLVTVLYGQELGLAPMQAVQGIYVVNGRPTLAGQTWLSLARKHGHRVKVDEQTTEKCTITMTRGDTGETHTETYTLEQAKAANLTNKDTWKNHPQRMLMWRAVGHACTFLCPEIALGFSPDAEDEAAPAMPSLAEVAANRDKPQHGNGAAEAYAERNLTGQEAIDVASGRKPIPEDVADAEVVEDEPAPPSAADLAGLAEQYNSVQDGSDSDDLFGGDSWPEVRQPGGGR